MQDKTFRLLFSGKIQNGFDQTAVWAELERRCKLSRAKFRRIQNKRKVAVLTKGLSADEAFKLQDELAAIGIKTHLKEDPEPISSFLLSSDNDSPPPQQMPGAPMPVAKPKNEFIFEFTGSGGEYFRIWIVNILLTIVTLGIYGAWAKVRNKQYLYGNTLLEGINFHYLAKPMMLLKGRLIAMTLVATYLLLSHFYPFYSIIFIFVLSLVFPFLAVRSLAFNARYSSYRNIRFDFHGSIGRAYMAFLFWPLLGALTFGLLLPFALYKQQRFFVENSSYGTTSFEFNNTVGSYYIFVILALLIMAGGMAFSIMVLNQFHPALVMAGIFATYLLFGGYFAVQMANALYNSTNISDIYFSSSMDTPSYMALFISNTLMMVLTLGLFYPWAKVRTMRYKTSRVFLAAHSGLDQFKSAGHEAAGATGQEVTEAFDMDFGL